MSDRIESIRKMLESDSSDIFLHYSLGMELASAERHSEAVTAFGRCIELDESYLAAHVEAAKALRSCGDLDAARDAFAGAMELAALQGETHVRDYIQQQLDSLPR